MRVWLACLLGALPLCGAFAQSSGPIDPARMSGIVRTLASDDFEGRAPGTPGVAKTVAWLVARLREIGVAPGGESGTYVQKVPLIRTHLPAGVVATVGATRLAQGQGIYLNTVRPGERLTIDHAPLVFVGYGVSAPERGWDDYKGVDLHGKIAVFLINDPDFAAQPGEPVAGMFGGRRETYYGRWTYKYEEAARRGDRCADRPRQRRRRLWLGDGDRGRRRELRYRARP